MSDESPAAGVLAIGDEIVTGQKLDTNSSWISSRLLESGYLSGAHESRGDDASDIAESITRLASRCTVLVVTGGLGPTADDLTRDGLARAMGDELVEDAGALEEIEAKVRARGRDMTEGARTQALRPSRGASLENTVGTAPGLRGRVGDCDVFCLPGPPAEMRPMFEREVAGVLKSPGGRVVRLRQIHASGIVESEAASRLGDLLARDRNPLVGITASAAVITCRVRYEGEADAADEALDESERAVREAMGPLVFGAGDQTNAGAALALLRSVGQTIATVESCTGGLIASMLTGVAGSSESVIGGWVTYSNETKTREVGVPIDVLERHGAVSAVVARAMSEGGLIAAQADHCLGVTGIAGPSGGTEDKPVGTVFIGVSTRDASGVRTSVRRFCFPGDREVVRVRTAHAALTMLRLRLLGDESQSLAHEIRDEGSSAPA